MNQTIAKDKKRHIIELDGMRGLAVLIVMMFHFNVMSLVPVNIIDGFFSRLLNAGWIGVDMFFALSGFLITGILIESKKRGNYFVSFYYKRTLRIFPLYYLYLIVLFVLFYPLIINKISAFEMNKVRYSQSIQIWFWLYLSNIKQAVSGKFSSAGSAHLWSLAIEEQFYLVWPLIVYITSLKWLRNISIGIIISSLLLRIYLHSIGWGALSIYEFTFTRIDTLAFGSLVAVCVKNYSHIPYQKITYLFYFLLACAILTLGFFGSDYHESPAIYVFSFTLLGATFATLILLLQAHVKFNFGIRKVFLTRWLVFLGKYSYALYIFHPFVRFILSKAFGKPVMYFNSQIPWQLFFMITGILLSILISQLSWHLFEKHFLRLKDKIK
ncbi:Peptidoglycan/LPS O-acetylase OafA/YrhL, contains acyltransferase and SGNH-hydrolase domains [Mucilaginibacter pineti]|uniref:Peptidoglycan/LPS O-acetylase OafA/YrhL, contains acyltransferase and SGNH-hydrolase domains n=1 Tax=Mucilaginibacter pineti TaxID=1391627 RepID=A0A1G6WC29_9SPHI|nr:acyltransferase [Mucilaginibacter pineti]SDD62625.1 Peptidoglycan/LPS O-acetylase OafA/YrhL, contains acyltransferase and SGNH-hydrolase domains [Mucilaginibacter pineti]